MKDIFKDPFFVCIYCGEFMNALTDEQIKIFGKPICCDFNMLKVEREKLHTMVRSIDTLKKNLEAEILKDAM